MTYWKHGCGNAGIGRGYLHSIYHPDCEYVDGVLEERNVGEEEPGWVQARFVFFFHLHYPGTGIVAYPEWRFQIRPNRSRIPDVTVTRGRPEGEILTTAPLLCIEILSPGDTFYRVKRQNPGLSGIRCPRGLGCRSRGTPDLDLQIRRNEKSS